MQLHDLKARDQCTFEYFNAVAVAVDAIRSQVGVATAAIVLGSGLGDFVKRMRNTKVMKYSQIPHMPGTSVAGHDGKLVVGDVPMHGGQARVMCFSGRVHSYEGWYMHQVNFIARVCARAGCGLVLLTNSAGGCLPGMEPGSIMVIRDHIRWIAQNPLLDTCDDPRFGPRHVNAAAGPYSADLAAAAQRVASEMKFKVHEGVYNWTSGPTYETPAEVQAGILLGGGAFGMSTVPEVLACAGHGVEVFGVSLCTNMAAGLIEEELTHADVQRVANEAGPRMLEFLVKLFERTPVPKCRAAANATYDPARLPAVTTSMVPVTPWTPTVTEVCADAGVLAAANKGAPEPRVALVIATPTPDANAAPSSADGLEAAIGFRLTDTRVLSLDALPNLSRWKRSRSASAQQGRVVFGSVTTKTGTVRVAVLAGLALEGLSAAESSFLAQVLKRVGVQSVVTVVAAVQPESVLPTQIDAKAAAAAATPAAAAAPAAVRLLAVSDVLDRTLQVQPLISDNTVLDAASVRTPVLDAGLYKAAQTLFGGVAGAGGVTSLSTGAYLVFPGPTLPTAAETAIARHAQCSAVGVSPLGVAQAARSLGLATASFAVLHDSWNGVVARGCAGAVAHAVAAPLTELLVAAGGATTKAAAAGASAGAAAAADTKSIAVSVTGAASVAADDTVAPTAAAPYTKETVKAPVRAAQDKYEHAVELANALVTALGSGGATKRPAMLFVDPRFNSVLASEFKAEKSVACTELPHFSAAQGGGGDRVGAGWRVSSGVWTSNGALVLVVHDPLGARFDVPSFARLTLLVRAAKHLRINSIALVTPAAAAVPGLAAGDVVAVSDHINLTGVNPLFGVNDDRYGVRFPDMGRGYFPPLTLAVPGLKSFVSTAAFTAPHAERAAQPTTSAVLACVSEPVAMESRVDARFARSLGASAVACGLQDLVIVARHSGLKACALAVITHSLAGAGADVAGPFVAPVPLQALTKEQSAVVGKAVTAVLQNATH